MTSKQAIITNDVETTSLWNHCLSDKTGEVVLKEGMPLLLEAYRKYGVKATFFFTGHIAKLFPDIVKMIVPLGHEAGCHGLVHDSNQAFDILSLEQQIDHLQRAKDILEDICQKEVVSFRAPALRVNKFTPKALAKTGFKIDSSVAPQRIDMFLSFGSANKMKWLAAPRTPYFTAPHDLSRRGDGPIFEVPINSFLLPYAGNTMRVSPLAARIVRSMLNWENSRTNRPVVFVIHPNELIEETVRKDLFVRRSKNPLKYLLADKLRYRLKKRNLGRMALPLLLEQLSYLKEKQFLFVTIKALADSMRRDK